MKSFIARLRNNETGASAVEFAIILPLLLVIVFGIIEFSLVFYNKAVITNASREGARQGILIGTATVPRRDEAAIRTVVSDYTDERLISFGTSSPLVVTADRASSDCTTVIGVPEDGIFSECLIVEVTYGYEFLILPGFIATLADVLEFNAKTTMFYE